MALTFGDLEIVLDETHAGKVVAVTIRGKLAKEEYETFGPEIERLIAEHGSLRMLVHLVDFEGWTAGALWEDTKFGAKHFSDFERVAIVGDKKWEKGMATFCKPFTKAKVRFFEDRGAAEAWVTEGLR